MHQVVRGVEPRQCLSHLRRHIVQNRKGPAAGDAAYQFPGIVCRRFRNRDDVRHKWQIVAGQRLVSGIGKINVCEFRPSGKSARQMIFTKFCAAQCRPALAGREKQDPHWALECPA